MNESEFAVDLRRRVAEAERALDTARAEGDFYGIDVRTGELDSLLRVAAENGIDPGH
ncbi:hypothetical protein [Kribbella lupini]|uniref:Uncharacterized protein n=1 Tax=Kribbella lupini TaxID=291602 RepID=A0ABP4LDN3_9ACTN